jgi:hypothetical protein
MGEGVDTVFGLWAMGYGLWAMGKKRINTRAQHAAPLHAGNNLFQYLIGSDAIGLGLVIGEHTMAHHR